ncbi:MAG: ArsR family transcriptional regulator [Methanomicrobiaceae archaeon]|nr:ArsR family transcriptional regulator [Methanomicrobiaceae archaeon]
MTGHIRIVNDPVEMVSLLLTFNDSNFKRVYDLLTKSWLTEEELEALVDADCVAECLTILKKGSLVEEQWRMPGPGESPKKEYKTTYNKFRANFQCSMQDLADIMYVATSTDEILRDLVDRMEEEVRLGNTSINDLARKFGVSPVCVKALAKRIPYLDVRGQGLVLLDRPDR